ncbi:unnamed protein product [Anisakis simplex]|uniref:Crossover junction endonuclease MUS81 n=1 Tax=Anisakis simplex TaxID=6269 RepID=A0A158PNA4_ANISI|nr:unnamed protein product [Anisakis simplex]
MNSDNDDVIVLSDDDSLNADYMSMVKTRTSADQQANDEPIAGTSKAVDDQCEALLEIPSPSSSYASSPQHFLSDEDSDEKKRISSENEQPKRKRPKCKILSSAAERSIVSILDATLIAAIDGLEDAVRTMLTECHIPNEICSEEGAEMCVRWRVNAGEIDSEQSNDGDEDSSVLLVLELLLSARIFQYYWRDIFVCMEGKKFDELIEQNALLDFIERRAGQNVVVRIVVYGSHKKQNELSMQIFDIFEEKRAHVHYVNTATDLARLIYHTHRAIARWKPEGDDVYMRGDDLVTDWWSKMLMHVPRMGNEERRALVRVFPNVFDLMKQLKQSGEDGIKLIAEIKTDAGRRIGPVLARKVFLMLTSETGEECIG